MFKRNYIDILDIADYIRKQFNDYNITHKKIQKLCYYIQAWSMVAFEYPIMDVEFEAWVHGPVSRKLYNNYKNGKPQLKEKLVELSERQVKLLDWVLKLYGDMTADELEELTHNEMPWQNARKDKMYWEPSTNTISRIDMQRYYNKLLNDDGLGQCFS